MIENDKIILAELTALVLSGKSLDENQQVILSDLMDKYPFARSYIEEIIKKELIEVSTDLSSIDIDKQWEKFTAKLPKVKKHPLLSQPWFKATGIAAALLCISILGLLWFIRNSQPDYLIEDHLYGQKNDVLPSYRHALFELNGKTVNELNNEKIDQIKENNLQDDLNYKIITPPRSSYSLVLYDGSKVWLNPESEIEYSSIYSLKERRVKLKGEAFIEVAKDPNRPFIIEANGLIVKALGTSFSIKNYQNEDPLVVLTEGRLLLNTTSNEAIIEAGDQANLINGELQTKKSSDLKNALAIKDGLFNFNNKDIKTILNEVKRWYGIHLRVERELSNTNYTGNIERDVTLAKLCEVLKDLTGYQYIIDKDELIVK